MGWECLLIKMVHTRDFGVQENVMGLEFSILKLNLELIID